MRLTLYTDYTLRVLIFCASNPDRSVTIGEIADAYAISKNHLMKVVNDLARQGILETTRGQRGGLRLLKPPALITVGAIVRASEPDFNLVECFDAKATSCRLEPQCSLKRVLRRAMKVYFEVLDRTTLADISTRTTPGGRIIPMIAMPLPRRARRL